MTNFAYGGLHSFLDVGPERSRTFVWYTKSLFPRTVGMLLSTPIARQNLPAPRARIVENQGFRRVSLLVRVILMDSNLCGGPREIAYGPILMNMFTGHFPLGSWHILPAAYGVLAVLQLLHVYRDQVIPLHVVSM